MTEEKKKILDRINILLDKRREELLQHFPSIHEINDGIILRFFTNWDNCDDDNKIKYKKIVNHDNPDEIIVFFFLPKDSYFQLKKREYIGCMTCLSGLLELKFGNNIRILNQYNKICLDSDEFEGRALENTYVITTNKP